jgi:thiamine biosynthesis lipoprotein
MISQINASDAEEFPMDPDLFNMLQMADSLWQITEGSFDPTIKPYGISGILGAILP